MNKLIRDCDISAITVAEFFLTKKELTPKKLQELVYYAYAWFIALNNENSHEIRNILFAEKPQAWVHGPVFPALFKKYREYGWHEVDKINDSIKFENDDVQTFLDKIWGKFGLYSADELESMTHSEEPWKEAREGKNKLEASDKELSLETIFSYYNELSAKLL